MVVVLIGLEILIFYMKYNSHTRQSVEEGLKLFESKSNFRFDRIIVVTPSGRIHVHKHNK